MSDERIDAIRAQVRAFPFERLHTPAESRDWLYGMPPSYLRDVCDFWLNEYDWRVQEHAINAVAQFTTTLDGNVIHFVHEVGSGDRPRPLLILHGWPYSFHSYGHLVDRLAHPERHGGRLEDAFTVVIPSMPGYPFSGKPAKPIGPRAITAMFDSLMVERLGLTDYLVHGGDWGGYMASLAGLDHPAHVAGVHIHYVALRDATAPLQTGKVSPDSNQDEKDFVAREMALWQAEGAYSQLQSTKPLALAAGMAGNPVGVAAWIIEKYHAWSDRRERSFEDVFTLDQLLTEVMLYLVTDAFDTATWIYAGQAAEGRVDLPAGHRVTVPTAIAAFPDPVFPPPPRPMVERSHNVVRYTSMPHGGHFPFYEASDLLLDDLRAFARTLPTRSPP